MLNGARFKGESSVRADLRCRNSKTTVIPERARERSCCRDRGRRISPLKTYVACITLINYFPCQAIVFSRTLLAFSRAFQSSKIRIGTVRAKLAPGEVLVISAEVPCWTGNNFPAGALSAYRARIAFAIILKVGSIQTLR